MHASVNEIKTTVEKQARELMSRPEEVLMQSVRSTSQGVIDNVNALKERGAQVSSHFLHFRSVRIFEPLLLVDFFRDSVPKG